MRLLIGVHLLDHGLQADHIARPHRAAAPGREAVTIDVDRIDVACTQRDALAEQLGAGIDELEQQALNDLLTRDGAPRDALALRLLDIHRLDLGIGLRRAAALLVDVEAAPRLLAEAAHLADL